MIKKKIWLEKGRVRKKSEKEGVKSMSLTGDWEPRARRQPAKGAKNEKKELQQTEKKRKKKRSTAK